MTINLQSLISCLDLNSKGDLQGALSLVFPIVDKASKEKYHLLKSNKERMVKYFNEVFNNIYLLKYVPNIHPIANNNIIYFTESGFTVGEILYSLRCQVLHESDCDYNIQFEPNIQIGCYRDAMNKEYIKFGNDLAIMLLLSTLIYNKNITFKNRETGSINIDGNTFEIAKLIGNPNYLKSGLHKEKYTNIKSNVIGLLKITLKNTNIGYGSIVSNINEIHEVTYTDCNITGLGALKIGAVL